MELIYNLVIANSKHGHIVCGRLQQKRATSRGSPVRKHAEEHSLRHLPILPETNQAQPAAHLCPIVKTHLHLYPDRKLVPHSGLHQKQQHHRGPRDDQVALQSNLRNLPRRNHKL